MHAHTGTRNTLAFRAETTIHVVLLTKAADLQVWASIHAGWATFPIDHVARTGLGWKNEKDSMSYLSEKSIIPQKKIQIIWPTPFKLVVSQGRLHFAWLRFVSELLSCFLHFLLSVLNKSSYLTYLQYQNLSFLMGTEFLPAENDFFIIKVIEEENSKSIVFSLLPYWYAIHYVWL